MAKRNYVSLNRLSKFLDNLKNLFATKEELDTKLEVKADKSHTHTISNITNLQSALDGKANSSHGTHVSYSTTNPLMDGTASVGTASTVSRSDHKHPSDTSRATKTEFDSHDSNTTKHITSTERANWNTAYNHSQSAHAPSDAEKNQNAFGKIKIGTTEIVADVTIDTLTFVAGNNVTLTPDANGDAITISSTNTNTTYSAGTGISLSGTTFSNSGVRNISTGTSNGTISVDINGATSNIFVKGLGSAAYTASTAYDAAGTAQTKADAALASAKTYADGIKNSLLNGAGTAYDTLKELGDLIVTNADAIDALETIASGKANASHTHTIANITNLQTTLDGKAASSHNHSTSNITSGSLSSDRLPTVPISKGGTGSTTADGALVNLGLTATATELNYVDGVTSNIQTQLNGKAASSHNHAASNITSGTLSLDRFPTISIAKGGTGATTAAGALTNLGLTATVDELNFVDGVTSNIQTQLDSKSNSSHTHNYAGSSSAGGSATSAVKLDTSTAGDANTPVYFSGGKPIACTSLDLNTTGSSASCTGNSATATKLATVRTIGLGTGVTGTATNFDGSGNITIPVTNIKEAYLSWGGRNLSGSVSPVDAAASNLHSANRFAFAKSAGITVEYSTDGSTYSAYSTVDTAKINLVSGNGTTYYIGARSSSTTVSDKLRITLHATNMGVYTRLRKLLINISTGYSSGSNVIIEKAMKGSESTFTTVGTYSISGWSGWNSIPIECAFGGGDTQTGNVAVLRLTFGITGVNANQTANALTILDINAIGDTYWSYPSNMAKTGHLYAYDSSQNATFPAKVTATSFSGSLSGNATTATTATKLGTNAGSATQPVYFSNGIPVATTYTLGKSVPSNAVFTDTDTKVTNTLATTTKAYVTGTTSATTNTGTQVFDTGVYLDTTAGKLTASNFSGTTFSGSGVATVSEVKTYLGIS